MKEFEKLVLPSTDSALRLRASSRREEYIGMRDKLHFDVEYSLSRLIKDEIDGLKELAIEMSLVKNRYDFSRVDVFRIVDKYRMNSLMREDLREFLNRNGIYANSLDSENLMSRMDKDGDGRITYNEFCEFLELGEDSGKSSSHQPMH
jgi:hypothetical protein